MKQVAKFEKVSFEQFKESLKDIFYGQLSEDKMKEMYENVKLPTRATKHSAGYDFSIPFSISLKAGDEIKIPTCIKCYMDADWVLKCYPRSGLGFKYRLQLNNTVGIIDGDYYNSDNEGHIFAKVINDSRADKILKLTAGDKFMQGIFLEYGITYDDNASETRNGGLGSTTRMSAEEYVTKQ